MTHYGYKFSHRPSKDIQKKVNSTMAQAHEKQRSQITGPQMSMRYKTGNEVLQVSDYYKGTATPQERRKFMKPGPRETYSYAPISEDINEFAWIDTQNASRKRLRENSERHMHKMDGMLPHGMTGLTPTRHAFAQYGGSRWRPPNRQHTVATALPRPIQKIGISGANPANFTQTSLFRNGFTEQRQETPQAQFFNTPSIENQIQKHHPMQERMIKYAQNFNNSEKTMMGWNMDNRSTARQPNNQMPLTSITELRRTPTHFEDTFIGQSLAINSTPAGTENRQAEYNSSTLDEFYRTMTTSMDHGSNKSAVQGNISYSTQVMPMSTKIGDDRLMSSTDGGLRNLGVSF